MAKTRFKKTLVKGIISPQDAEAAFAELAKSDARLQQITAQMDLQISKIREKNQDEMSELNEVIEDKKEYLSVYASQHPELFAKAKSIEMVHGKIGFRTGTPKLKNLKGFTWASVLNLVKEYMPQFVRTKDELDKESLIAERDNPEVSEKFKKIGVCVDQDETFFAEPKKEETAA